MKFVDTSTEHLNDMIEGLELTTGLLTQPGVEYILHPMVLRYLICFLFFCWEKKKKKLRHQLTKKMKTGP